MIYPVPTHLRDLLAVDSGRSNEHNLRGGVKCACGSDSFHPLYVADRVGEPRPHFLRVAKIGEHYFLRLGARCVSCSREHLLLDHDCHGWNGYVCGVEEDRLVPRPPYQMWTCQRCGSTAHRIALGIVGEDMEVALQESDGTLTEADWFDGFGWFTLEVACASCNFGPVEIVDYETM